MKSEAQLRREAARQGYSLKKSRSSYSVDNLGGYRIVDPNTNFIVSGEHFNLSPEDVEKFLSEE